MTNNQKVSAAAIALSADYQLARQEAQDKDMIKKVKATLLLDQLYADGAVSGERGGMVNVDGVNYIVRVAYDMPNADKYDETGALKKAKQNAKALRSLYTQALANVQNELANIIALHPKIKAQMKISISTKEK